MTRWLKETHGPTFELLRHFLRSFFDSEWVTHPGQTIPVLIGTVPVLFQWFLLLVSPLRHKYAHLAALATPGPYREAVRADELWLITLMMSVIGLLTAIKWQTLFPDLRDYRALGTLPLRPIQIFGAKLTALLLVAAAALITVNFLPSIGFPALSTSRWATEASFGARVRAQSGASLAGCACFFFGPVALQGVLLNLLPPRAFGRVAGYLQGAMVGLMLGLAVVSFSIQPQITNFVIRPEWARWLPPVWFLGLNQALAGDPDPAMRLLAGRAWAALESTVVLALLAYLVSYHRHRTLLMEGLSLERKRGCARWSFLVQCFSLHPRRQAIASFILRTLGRSNPHRTILMGYAGLGFALLVTGVATLKSAAADFVYYHLLALVFLLIGARHLFSRPTELKANWIFQIMERDGRVEWMRAVDGCVLLFGAVPLLLIPLPAEVHLLGMRGLAEATLSAVLGLAAYDWTFANWSKLPFTCSHLPGGTPTWMVLGALGLFGALGLLHSVLLAALYNWRGYATLLMVLLAVWGRMRLTRRQNWLDVRLKYEEAPELEVEGLNLLK